MILTRPFPVEAF